MLLENALADFVELLFKREEKNTILSSDQRLIIHYDNYVYSLTHALQCHYPMTVTLLGEDFFTTLANQYIHHYPSLSAQLNDYGAYFPSFLAKHDRITTLQYVVDIARLEWLCHTLPIADTVFTIDEILLTELNDNNYNNISLELNPSLQLIASHYPLPELISYCQSPNDSQLQINQTDCYLLMMKNADGLTFFSILETEYYFLTALKNELPINNALENILIRDPSFKLADILVKWVKTNVVVGLTGLKTNLSV